MNYVRDDRRCDVSGNAVRCAQCIERGILDLNQCLLPEPRDADRIFTFDDLSAESMQSAEAISTS